MMPPLIKPSAVRLVGAAQKTGWCRCTSESANSDGAPMVAAIEMNSPTWVARGVAALPERKSAFGEDAGSLPSSQLALFRPTGFVARMVRRFRWVETKAPRELMGRLGLRLQTLERLRSEKRRPHKSAKNHRSRADSRKEDLQVFRRVVPRDGIEPPTLRFSVACSTN